MFAKFYPDELKKCPDCGQYIHVDSTGRRFMAEHYRGQVRIVTGLVHRCPPAWERRGRG